MDDRVKKMRASLLQIAPDVFMKGPILFAYLYGGYAAGVVHPFSDLDIGIYVETMPIREYLKLELSTSLEIDEKLGYQVASEVRVMNILPLMVAGNIITEGILIFSRDEATRIDYETSIRRTFFDFLPVIRQYQREYVALFVS
jgi:predicted nucleotidyltransferase